MGSDIEFDSTPPTIEFEVIGTAPITSITLVRNNENIKLWKPGTEKAAAHWTDQNISKLDKEKNIYYYLVVQQSNKEMAWTSPVFLSKN